MKKLVGLGIAALTVAGVLRPPIARREYPGPRPPPVGLGTKYYCGQNGS